MSNCHSKYLNKIYNKNNKLNIDNDDYVNVFLKIINDAERRCKTTLNSQRVYPDSILRNKNTTTNGKSYEYFAKKNKYILENPELRYRRTTNNFTNIFKLRDRIRRKIREINLRKYGHYSRSFSSFISRL